MMVYREFRDSREGFSLAEREAYEWDTAEYEEWLERTFEGWWHPIDAENS